VSQTVATERPIRVAVIDDHVAITRGALDLLRESLEIVDPLAARHVSEVLADAAGFDLVVLDLRLDDGSDAAENVRLLQGRGWPVLLYTEASAVDMARCVEAGVAAVVSKAEPGEHLREAAEAILAGQPYLSSTWAEALQACQSQPHFSPQQEAVLRLYAAGLKMSDVAAQLYITENTARAYLKAIRAKFPSEQVGTKTGLANAARKFGYLDPGTH